MNKKAEPPRHLWLVALGLGVALGVVYILRGRELLLGPGVQAPAQMDALVLGVALLGQVVAWLGQALAREGRELQMTLGAFVSGFSATVASVALWSVLDPLTTYAKLTVLGFVAAAFLAPLLVVEARRGLGWFSGPWWNFLAEGVVLVVLLTALLMALGRFEDSLAAPAVSGAGLGVLVLAYWLLKGREGRL